MVLSIRVTDDELATIAVALGHYHRKVYPIGDTLQLQARLYETLARVETIPLLQVVEEASRESTS